MKSIKDIFPKGLIDQEAINELKKLIESDQKNSRDDLACQNGDTKKKE